MYKTAVAVSLVCAAIPAYFLRKLRILHVDGVCSSIYWTTRSWLWNDPFPQVYHEWYDSREQEKYWKSRIQLIRVCAFLRPFFATHGYDLYVFKNPDNISEELLPCSTSVVFTAEAAFPYGRCLYKDNMATGFVYSSLRVWPARDRHGRDVVIKAISTKELQALRPLQSDALKNDPQNHTIPVLEFLDFAGQAFVVMPRWDAATCADFVKVGELVRYGRAFFEVVAFLHRNGIGHGDISLQNMAMDLILPILFDTCVAGVRGPERRYALIDFETARLVDVDQRLDDEPLLIPAIFKRDIKMFARSAEINLRCIQDVLPELEPLFVAMHDINGPTQPTAAAALARFEEMCSTLSTEDLERSAEAISWTGGRTIYRKGPPVYYE